MTQFLPEHVLQMVCKIVILTSDKPYLLQALLALSIISLRSGAMFTIFISLQLMNGLNKLHCLTLAGLSNLV
jgi:hypothetical protein